MKNTLTEFGGNTTTCVNSQGKYRIVHRRDGFAVELVIETADGIRSYPASQDHPLLIKMVNTVKIAANGREGGQFYINEWRQIIVPAGDPVRYFYAGEYHIHVVLRLDKHEFSGRPHDEKGNLLRPGDDWTDRPRPGMQYVLTAGGTDIKYVTEIEAGVEKIIRLSQQVGEQQARRTARKISAIKGNKGGRFYINEYRAIFAPCDNNTRNQFTFIGVLTDEDAWFQQWYPNDNKPLNKKAQSVRPSDDKTNATQVHAVIKTTDFAATEKKLEIADGAIGNSMELLFSAYMKGATLVEVKDPFMVRPHQLANLLRFVELLVRLGTVESINLVTKEITDDSRGRLETIKQSLSGYDIRFEYTTSSTLHDRKITTDTGWEINLGRGLDIYKRPDDWLAVGATDFALRPCYETTLIYHRMGTQNGLKASA